jgi:hypothetical protein
VEIKALIRFTNDFVMMPRPTTKALWQSDPHFAFVSQLKSYQGTFGNTVGRRWLHKLAQARSGKPHDLAQAAGVVGTAGLMALTAMASNELRERWQYGPKGDPKRKNESMTSKTLRAMDRAGFSGGLQPAVDLLWQHGGEALAA